MPPPQNWLALFKGINDNRTPIFHPLEATVVEASAAGIMNLPKSQRHPQLSRFLSVNMRFPARCMRFTCGLVKKAIRLPLQQRLNRTSLFYSPEKRKPTDGYCGPQVGLFSKNTSPFEASKCLTRAHPVASSPGKLYCARGLMTAVRDCASSAWKPKVHWSEPLVTAVHDHQSASPSVHWGEPLVTAVHECASARPRVHWGQPLVTAVHECRFTSLSVHWDEPLVTAVHECPSARPRVHWGQPLVTAVHDCPSEWPGVRWSDPLVTVAHECPPEYYIAPDSRPLGHRSTTAIGYMQWSRSSGAAIDVDESDEDDEREVRDEGFFEYNRGADFVFERPWTI